MRVMAGAEQIVRDLFARYRWRSRRLPEHVGPQPPSATERRRAAVVADFVAGMTDRYALSEHRRLFDATPDLR